MSMTENSIANTNEEMRIAYDRKKTINIYI